jgi:LysM repeat protein
MLPRTSQRIGLVLVVSATLFVTAALAQQGYRTTYVVKRGDTLSKIAKKKDCTVRKLKRWNRIRGSRLRVGQKLTIYSMTPLRPKRTVEYRIKRGDSLNTIAKRFRVKKRDIRRWNRMRRGRTRLIAGRTLKIIVTGPENPSETKGRPQQGKLVNGEQLKSGPGYWVRNKARAWGANHVITHLMTCLPRVKKTFRRMHKVVIGDISREHGGSFPPHRSHQNGLDVDLSYIHKGVRKLKNFRRATAANLDVVKTWYMIDTFLDTNAIEYMFIDYKLQKLLYNQARKKGYSKRQLKETFQYPRGRGRTKGIIRHSPSHKNHIHIRFKPSVVPQAKSKGRHTALIGSYRS